MKTNTPPDDQDTIAMERSGPVSESINSRAPTKTIQSDLKLQPYKRTKSLLTATVLLQTALICAPAISRTMILNSGKTVVLKTVPVDPYDMFRGDYVALKYDISTANASGAIPNGTDVYIVLEPRGAYWERKSFPH